MVSLSSLRITYIVFDVKNFSNNFTKSLIDLGLENRRFKKGTAMRVHLVSIDYSKVEIQKGEENIS